MKEKLNEVEEFLKIPITELLFSVKFPEDCFLNISYYGDSYYITSIDLSWQNEDTGLIRHSGDELNLDELAPNFENILNSYLESLEVFSDSYFSGFFNVNKNLTFKGQIHIDQMITETTNFKGNLIDLLSTDLES